jgi:hypothetical protein
MARLRAIREGGGETLMPYDVRMRMPNGSIAWLRMAGRRPASCIVCGAPSTKLCDWKIKDTERPHPPIVGRAKSRRPRKTCSAPLCDSCTSSPAPGKDLCPTHAAAWAARTSVTQSRQVVNPPADEAEARNLANTAPLQPDSDGERRGEIGPSSEPEARPVMPTAQFNV